jgi:hypothetical protein
VERQTTRYKCQHAATNRTAGFCVFKKKEKREKEKVLIGFEM